MNLKIKIQKVLVTFVLSPIFIINGNAQENIPPQHPIIQTKYTADPAPMVHNDTVFLYTSHDEDDAKGFKKMCIRDSRSPCSRCGLMATGKAENATKVRTNW